MFKVIKSEKGIGFVEVLMALALLGIIAATFLMAIGVASRAILIADERTTAEDLAKSQMEYIRAQGYIKEENVNDEVYDAIYTNIKVGNADIGGDPQYSSFNIGSIIEVDEEETAIDDIVGIPWDTDSGMPNDTDEGLQRIKLIVCNNGDDGVSLEDYILILEDFKVDR